MEGGRPGRPGQAISMQGPVSPQKAKLNGLSGPEEGEKGTAQSGETVGPQSPLNNMRQG